MMMSEGDGHGAFRLGGDRDTRDAAFIGLEQGGDADSRDVCGKYRVIGRGARRCSVKECVHRHSGCTMLSDVRARRKCPHDVSLVSIGRGDECSGTRPGRSRNMHAEGRVSVWRAMRTDDPGVGGGCTTAAAAAGAARCKA